MRSASAVLGSASWARVKEVCMLTKTPPLKYARLAVLSWQRPRKLPSRAGPHSPRIEHAARVEARLDPLRQSGKAHILGWENIGRGAHRGRGANERCVPSGGGHGR